MVKMGFHRVPNELLQHILAYIDLDAEVAYVDTDGKNHFTFQALALAQVSSQFRMGIHRADFWIDKSFEFESLIPKTSQDLPAHFKSNLPELLRRLRMGSFQIKASKPVWRGRLLGDLRRTKILKPQFNTSRLSHHTRAESSSLASSAKIFIHPSGLSRIPAIRFVSLRFQYAASVRGWSLSFILWTSLSSLLPFTTSKPFRSKSIANAT
jgi:hypothetical protein